MINLEDLIWVRLPEPDNFLKVKETLSRIGIASKKDKILYQSCHILHKQGRYAIVHFKQMFMLDGKRSDFSQDDQDRLNTIAFLLDEWRLVELVDPEKVEKMGSNRSQVTIIPYKEKGDWKIVTKYNIGKPYNKDRS